MKETLRISLKLHIEVSTQKVVKVKAYKSVTNGKFVPLREIRIELSMIGFLAIEMSILKYSDNSLINMNTLNVSKKCIQIVFSECT